MKLIQMIKNKNMKKVGLAAGAVSGIAAFLTTAINNSVPTLLSSIGKVIAHSSTFGCLFVFSEESKMPESLIK